jgi:hypothetical protein
MEFLFPSASICDGNLRRRGFNTARKEEPETKVVTPTVCFRRVFFTRRSIAVGEEHQREARNIFFIYQGQGINLTSELEYLLSNISITCTFADISDISFGTDRSRTKAAWS